MNIPSHDPWQELFEQLPTDTSTRQDHQQRLRQQVLDSYDQPVEVSTWKNQLKSTGQYLMTHKTPRWVAAAASLLIAAWFVVSTGSQPAFAMEELFEKILNARTARFDNTINPENKPSTTFKVFFSEPNRFRMEMQGGFVQIADFSAGKMMLLDPNTKMATEYNLTNLSKDQKKIQQTNEFELLRRQIRKAQADSQKNVEPLGEKLIDGRTVVGFRLPDAGPVPMTVWVDPATKLPHEIKSTSQGPPPTESILTNFEFDIELDEALFRVEAPEGYQKITLNLDASSPSEQDLIQSLTMFCEATGGQFPANLSVTTGASYLRETGLKENGQAVMQKEIVERSNAFNRGLRFALLQPMRADAHYAGKDVTQGQSDQPVFWYKPAGQDKWRVLDANLEFHDADQAPVVEGAVKILTE